MSDNNSLSSLDIVDENIFNKSENNRNNKQRFVRTTENE